MLRLPTRTPLPSGGRPTQSLPPQASKPCERRHRLHCQPRIRSHSLAASPRPDLVIRGECPRTHPSRPSRATYLMQPIGHPVKVVQVGHRREPGHPVREAPRCFACLRSLRLRRTFRTSRMLKARRGSRRRQSLNQRRARSGWSARAAQLPPVAPRRIPIARLLHHGGAAGSVLRHKRTQTPCARPQRLRSKEHVPTSPIHFAGC